MKKILMISTGGTIACKINEYGGLEPTLTSSELVDYVPELREICDVDLIQLFNIDSTNMGPDNWLEIVKTIKERYTKYNGIVITHGTDTMAYSAAAISYLIQNLPIPIVFTGSQKSIANKDTDARNNLLCAFKYAVSNDAWGVHIVFDNKAILATRARKVRSKSFNAFNSIDYPETAVFSDRHLINFISHKPTKEPTFYGHINPRIFVLRLIPGIRSEVLDIIRDKYDGLIIEGFGVGGLPDYNDKELLHSVTKWSEEGKLVVFSTQVQHEGSDMNVYEVGRLAKELPGIIEARDMTPEAIVTKLMWVLGHCKSRQEAQDRFLQPIQFDLLNR